MVTFSTYSSSPADACPDTCTSALPLCTMRAPQRVRPLMTRLTAFSLPGISEDASSTVSPSVMRIEWSRFAIRDSADIGSPCDPVHTSTSRSPGMPSSSFCSTMMPSGTLR